MQKCYSRFQQTFHTRVPNYIRKLTSGRRISELRFEVRNQFRNFDLALSLPRFFLKLSFPNRFKRGRTLLGETSRKPLTCYFQASCFKKVFD